MKHDLTIKNGIVIPEHELEISTSRSGGPGGQYVNKTDTRVMIRWNVKNTTVLSQEQKERVLNNLRGHVTEEGDVIVHNSESRSQHQNRELARAHLAQKIRAALYVPKKRIATKIPKVIQESRLRSKSRRGTVKRLRSKKIQED